MDKREKKPNKFAIFIKKHKILTSIVGLFLLFVISLGGTMGILNATRPKEVTLPNLVGKTVEEAKQILAESKLVFAEGEAEYNAQHEAGKIISQDPQFKAGKNVKENTTVKVIASLGTEKTIVPKLEGKTKDEAEQTAKEAKIELDIIEETSETVEAGVIVKQEVEPETEVNAGDVVKVYLSTGTGRTLVLVPSVLYKEEAVAKKTLEDAKFEVSVEYAEDKARGNGVVLKQSIKPDETVDEGSKITITVNKLAEEKECEVKINVSKLTDYTVKTEEVEGEDGEMVEKEVEAEKVTVAVYVDNSEFDTGSTKRDNEKYATKITGTGTVTIKVVIKNSEGDTLATKTKTKVNLNTTNSVSFE